MLACPSRSETIFGWTPWRSISVACAMTEIVEPDVGEPTLPTEPVPGGGDGVGVHRSAVAAVDHEVEVLPVGGGLPSLRLFVALTLEVGP